MVRHARLSSSDEGPIDRDLGWDRGFDDEEDIDESVHQSTSPSRRRKRSRHNVDDPPPESRLDEAA